MKNIQFLLITFQDMNYVYSCYSDMGRTTAYAITEETEPGKTTYGTDFLLDGGKMRTSKKRGKSSSNLELYHPSSNSCAFYSITIS